MRRSSSLEELAAITRSRSLLIQHSAESASSPEGAAACSAHSVYTMFKHTACTTAAQSASPAAWTPASANSDAVVEA